METEIKTKIKHNICKGIEIENKLTYQEIVNFLSIFNDEFKNVLNKKKLIPILQEYFSLIIDKIQTYITTLEIDDNTQKSDLKNLILIIERLDILFEYFIYYIFIYCLVNTVKVNYITYLNDIIKYKIALTIIIRFYFNDLNCNSNIENLQQLYLNFSPFTNESSFIKYIKENTNTINLIEIININEEFDQKNKSSLGERKLRYYDEIVNEAKKKNYTEIVDEAIKEDDKNEDDKLKITIDSEDNLTIEEINYNSIKDIIINLFNVLLEYKKKIENFFTKKFIFKDKILKFLDNFINYFEGIKIILEKIPLYIYNNNLKENYLGILSAIFDDNNIYLYLFKLLNTLLYQKKNMESVKYGIKILYLIDLLKKDIYTKKNSRNYDSKINSETQKKSIIDYFINVKDTKECLNFANNIIILNIISIKKEDLNESKFEEYKIGFNEELVDKFKICYFSDGKYNYNIPTTNSSNYIAYKKYHKIINEDNISEFIFYIKNFMDSFVLTYINTPDYFAYDRTTNIEVYLATKYYSKKFYFKDNLIYILDLIKDNKYTILTKNEIINILNKYINFMIIINIIANNTNNYLILAISIEFIRLLNEIIKYLNDENYKLNYIEITEFNLLKEEKIEPNNIVGNRKYDFFTMNRDIFMQTYSDYKEYLIIDTEILLKFLLEKMIISRNIVTLNFTKSLINSKIDPIIT